MLWIPWKWKILGQGVGDHTIGGGGGGATGPGTGICVCMSRFFDPKHWSKQRCYDYSSGSANSDRGHTNAQLLQKREITSLCRITLLTLDLTPCLRDRSFDLRGRHVRKMTYAKLGWRVQLNAHRNCLRQRHETAYARACARAYARAYAWYFAK